MPPPANQGRRCLPGCGWGAVLGGGLPGPRLRSAGRPDSGPDPHGLRRHRGAQADPGPAAWLRIDAGQRPAGERGALSGEEEAERPALLWPLPDQADHAILAERVAAVDGEARGGADVVDQHLAGQLVAAPRQRPGEIDQRLRRRIAGQCGSDRVVEAVEVAVGKAAMGSEVPLPLPLHRPEGRRVGPDQSIGSHLLVETEQQVGAAGADSDPFVGEPGEAGGAEPGDHRALVLAVPLDAVDRGDGAQLAQERRGRRGVAADRRLVAQVAQEVAADHHRAGARRRRLAQQPAQQGGLARDVQVAQVDHRPGRPRDAEDDVVALEQQAGLDPEGVRRAGERDEDEPGEQRPGGEEPQCPPHQTHLSSRTAAASTPRSTARGGPASGW